MIASEHWIWMMRKQVPWREKLCRLVVTATLPRKQSSCNSSFKMRSFYWLSWEIKWHNILLLLWDLSLVNIFCFMTATGQSVISLQPLQGAPGSLQLGPGPAQLSTWHMPINMWKLGRCQTGSFGTGIRFWFHLNVCPINKTSGACWRLS